MNLKNNLKITHWLSAIFIVLPLLSLTSCSKDENNSAPAPADPRQQYEEQQRQMNEQMEFRRMNFLNGQRCGDVVTNDFSRLRNHICASGDFLACSKHTQEFLQKYPGVHCVMDSAYGVFNDSSYPTNASPEGRTIFHGHLNAFVSGVYNGLLIK